MVYWAHLVSSWLVRYLPRSVTYGIANVLAPLVSVLWERQHRCATANMARVLGPGSEPPEIRRLVRQVFRNYAAYMVDLLRLPGIGLHEVERNFRVVGLEHIEAGLRLGRGLVLVTAHIGNWDAAGAFLSRRGYPVNVIVETLDPPRWNERVQSIRRQIGMQAIPLESGVRLMLQALRRNEILGVLIDRPLAGEGVPVEFFGESTRVPAGAARLALRAGAQVVVAATIRTPHGFLAQVSPLVEIEPTGDAEQDVQNLTQRVMSWLEGQIRRHPDQWFMFRDMWPEALPARP